MGDSQEVTAAQACDGLVGRLDRVASNGPELAGTIDDQSDPASFGAHDDEPRLERALLAFKPKTNPQVQGGYDLATRENDSVDEWGRVGNGRDVFDHLHVLDVAGA